MTDRAKYEEQALWSIGPGVSIEAGSLAPEARDLSVPAFVRRERSAPEGRAEPDGEEHGGGYAQVSTAQALLATAAFAAALTPAILGLGLFSLRPDRYLFVLLAPALVIRRGRRYLLDFVPYALLIVLYAELRGVAHLLNPQPYYLPQLHVERLLFAGHLPSVDLQHWLWSGQPRWYDHALNGITRIHGIVPTTFGFVLWVKRRTLFYQFAASMLALSYVSAVVFLLYPAAPPWAASDTGRIEGVTRLVGRHTGGWVHDNPYAAIPSLHGGYSFLVFLFLAVLVWKTRWRWALVPAALYPLAQGFAVVYTGNHYVVDLLVGWAFAAAALLAVRAYWRRRGLPA